MNRGLKILIGVVEALQLVTLAWAIVAEGGGTTFYGDFLSKALTCTILSVVSLAAFALLYRNPQACNFPRPPRDLKKAYEIMRTYILIIMSEMATLCFILSFLPFYPTWLLVMLVIGWTVVTIATMVKYIGRLNRS